MPLPLLLLPLLLLLDRVEVVQSLQNGAARTPPMGWLSWQRYRCSEEFNETLIRDTADALVSEGYKDAGYEYVCLDDCWQGRRDKDGHLAANPEKFPSGIKALAAYVHSKVHFPLPPSRARVVCMGIVLGVQCEYEFVCAHSLASPHLLPALAQLKGPQARPLHRSWQNLLQEKASPRLRLRCHPEV